MPPIYKRYYVAEFFAAIAFLAHLGLASVSVSTSSLLLGMDTAVFALVFYHLPLAVSVTIGVLTTWKYWGWLVVEREK